MNMLLWKFPVKTHSQIPIVDPIYFYITHKLYQIPIPLYIIFKNCLLSQKHRGFALRSASVGAKQTSPGRLAPRTTTLSWLARIHDVEAKRNSTMRCMMLFLFNEASGIRTPDNLIKSQVLISPSDRIKPAFLNLIWDKRETLCFLEKRRPNRCVCTWGFGPP